MDESSKALLTVSGLLFGFLFTAFWWILNRDLRFKPENRHFKPATGMLITSLVLLGVFGIVAPLKQAAKANPALLWSYRGVLLALLSVLGYMLTDLGHLPATEVHDKQRVGFLLVDDPSHPGVCLKVVFFPSLETQSDVIGRWPALEVGRSFWVAHPCESCKGGAGFC
jgi:hypothetical protein